MTAISDAESATFLAACRSCSRKASKHLGEGTHPLQDQALASLAARVLGQAKGPLVDTATPFTATIWKHGATHVGKTSPGVPFQESIGAFVKLLEWRATQVAPKRSGWVVEPTANKDGRRTNESTKSVHAVFLDADEAGNWDWTLSSLGAIGLSFVAYQSGGWTEEKPKWRIAIPLATPFSTKDEAERDVWKSIYLMVRVLVGTVGNLKGAGFDAATDTPCCPWFLTEKRNAADPPRKVLFKEGASLSLLKLSMILPAVEEERELLDHEVRPPVARIALAETRLEEIVAALIPVTSEVHKKRRDLYLALPGALLDRGIAPDDVIEICEAVSGAYTGGDAEKHADNVRAARTTASKWEAGGAVTRIGTLNSTWPNVAKVLDEVLPDAWKQYCDEKTKKLLEDGMKMALGLCDQPPQPPPPPIASYASEVATAKEILSANLPPIAPLPPTTGSVSTISTAQIKAIIRKKRNSNSVQSKFDADLIDNFLAGELFVTKADIERSPELSKFDGEKGLDRVAWILGNNVPPDASWDSILNLRPQGSRAPLSRETLVKAGERFEAAKKKKVAYVKKKEREKEAERAAFRERTRDYGARMKMAAEKK